MGKLVTGIIGGFTGKVGPVVGSSYKGVPYLKSRPDGRTKKISAKEKANRQKFKVAQEWLSPLLHFVRQGYKGYAPRVEGFIAAKSYLMKNVMETAGKDIKINPSLMKVSVGTLPLSRNITVKAISKIQLQFTWDTESVDKGSAQDQVMLLAYNIKNHLAYSNIAGEFRKTGSATLPVELPKGASCHVWLAFVAFDRSQQSDSVYLGEIKF